MGICTFGNVIQNNSLIVEDPQKKNINKLIYPKHEFYYSIYSNYHKKCYDKISLYLTYNNSTKDENSLFKFKVYFKIPNKKDEYVLEGITEEKKGKETIIYEKYFDIEFIFENEQIIKIICLQNNNEIQTCILSVGRLIGCKSNSVKIPIKNNTGFTRQLGELHLEPEVVQVEQQESDNDDTQNEHVLRLPIHTFLTCLDGVTVVSACAIIKHCEVDCVAEMHQYT